MQSPVEAKVYIRGSLSLSLLYCHVHSPPTISTKLSLHKPINMSASQLNDVEWLFFDVFGTVADCKPPVSTCQHHVMNSTHALPYNLGKSHISSTLCRISQKFDPDTYELHPKPDDEFWKSKAQDWRTRFMSHIKTKQGNREPGGMDVSQEILVKEKCR
jgi:hypothetical protein